MMFNNRKSDKLEMVIGENSRITGYIESAGTILIEGTVLGNLSGNKVILGEKSYVKGDISANNISIAGKIEGHLKGRDGIDVRATGHISGDIVTRRLSMMKGGVFNGMSSMEDGDRGKKDETDKKVVEFAAKER
ncbi:MAG TPA: polymer-forming cytoskeletal protein [Syntrophales bacterium]|nr:polymer-forming cytoskeletal protein [Syntrophales bacterium]